MIGGRVPLHGRKAGDRRVRIERPRTAYFRYAGPNQLIAREVASRPRSPAGRALARTRSLLFGRPLSNYEEIEERLPKKKALAIFSSDPISSSAYATEEILRVLVLAGTGAPLLSLPVAAAIALLSPVGLQLGVIVVLLMAAVPVCGVAARELGSSGDPGAIVLDEIVALPIVYLAAPPMTWTILLVGYVLFRICDIWKPGLARAAERLPGGLGIVADDAVAAVLAALLLQILFWVDRQAGYEWLAASA